MLSTWQAWWLPQSEKVAKRALSELRALRGIWLISSLRNRNVSQVVTEGLVVMLCTDQHQSQEQGSQTAWSLVNYIASQQWSKDPTAHHCLFRGSTRGLWHLGGISGCSFPVLWKWRLEVYFRGWGFLRPMPGFQASMLITQVSTLTPVSQASLKSDHANNRAPVTPGVHRRTSNTLGPTGEALEIWA